VFGHLVPQKGLDERNIACDFVLGDLEWLGHTRVIVKADNEPAVQALVNRVVELAKIECSGFDQLAKEQPAAYDSQSNGGTEVGVRLARGLLRTVKLCLEARIGKYIPVDHAVMPWMRRGRHQRMAASTRQAFQPAAGRIWRVRTVSLP
jgi:hypothetical protein